jgi:glycosyltransferase involved in cell wall biosynthesis
MKVLVISSKFLPEYAGSALRAHNTYKRLKSKFNIDYDVIANSIEHTDNTRYQFEGVVITRLSRRLPQIQGNSIPAKLANHIIYLLNFIYQGFLTLRILKAGNYDLIHTFGSSISVNVGILYAKYKNKALLREICNHGAYPRPNLPLKLNKLLKYNFYPKSKVVAISKRVADLCRGDGIAEDNLWERPNPVDETKFSPTKGNKYSLRKKLTKFGDDALVLVDISKFMPRKNKIFLTEVMEHLDDKYKLLIFGPIISKGPLLKRDKKCFDDIIKSIEEKKLSNRVQVITGFAKAVEEYFKLADVFVFPTLADALGTPMLEAIACGIPVVASKIEGITDYWIENGKTGYVCELDPQKFAECIVKACQITEDTLKENSAAILEKASTEVIDQQYYNIMKNLVDKP